MGKSQRDKGKRGERAVKRMFYDAGFEDAERNLNDVIDGQGIDVTAGNFAIQVKVRKNSVPMNMLYEVQTGNNGQFELLASKVDRQPWLVTMRLNDFLTIMQDIGAAYKYEAPPF